MIRSIVVVGGGAAGWITAGLIAARYRCGDAGAPISVTLVESPTIGIIGVGEGTWPTMGQTLRQMGIAESDFIRACDATFKQGSKFIGWVTGAPGDAYYHPFSLPQGFDEVNLAARWQEKHRDIPFAAAVGIQAALCDAWRAPKPLDAADYASVENHGYHLDAGKFAAFLADHSIRRLGVRHHLADITGVKARENGDIASLTCADDREIPGDLFIDCSGTAALLIGRHYKVPFISRKDTLFIDRAIAAQVPYPAPDAEIESATLSTATDAGWIWDIGLPSRRGVGHVYSSTHTTPDAAKATLEGYIARLGADPASLQFRDLAFEPGHRETFWVNNCVAVGMAAGFLEPLEASALVMVELAAAMIARHLPAAREGMDVVAGNFNRICRFRWDRIVDFLKLHYILSQRSDSAFWRDNRRAESVPESLTDLLTLWRHQPPANNGFLSPYDPFPASSYQYVLYGMGFETLPCHLEQVPERIALADMHLQKARDRNKRIPALLPGNRALITAIRYRLQIAG
ncbi:tryptophan halogenase family protein [Gimibacter soli]|uniref:Tryptophan 7-halogenase n=1 Tax=Gimibacter soli TaxID=3024400 RepID=A0AAE9XTZ2_9PROT|nr:tryptophan halogenase family protein [Gimibacter soli]WCL54395.1 tryptophan 7-halogenase [Gimibacter soli]